MTDPAGVRGLMRGVLLGKRCDASRQQPRAGARCFRLRGPVPDRPDLAIFSQNKQFVLGNPPPWDSRDMVTNFWNPFRLMPQSTVTIRNLLPTASAVNVQVLFSTATFGIGQPFVPLYSQFVTLAPSQQISLTFPFPQAVLNATEQRIAVLIWLIHPYDGKESNNERAQLLADAYTSKSGRRYSISFSGADSPGCLRAVLASSTAQPAQCRSVSRRSHVRAARTDRFKLNLQVAAGIHGTTAIKETYYGRS